MRTYTGIVSHGLLLIGIELFVVSLSFGANSAPRGILIEGEDPSRIEKKTHWFAQKRPDPSASDRNVMLAYNFNGVCFYDVTLPSDGLWRVWLRYSGTGKPKVALEVDPSARNWQDISFTYLRPPGTPMLKGEGAWMWYKLVEKELKAGKHTLALSGAGLRPDCLFVTRSDAEIDDAVARLPRPVETDEATLRALAKHQPAVSPSFLAEEANYRLPDWFENARIQAHVRLPVHRYKDEDIFLRAAEVLRPLGVTAMSRHVKSVGRPAPWDSAVGATDPDAEATGNKMREMFARSRAAGVNVIAYYYHITDNWVTKERPEWLSRDSQGRPIDVAAGEAVCLNSPYREFLKTRYLELVDMGAKGVYYDYIHMPPDGCFCQWCARGFKEETGLELPPMENEYDPVYRRLVDFKNQSIERCFLEWRRAIHERDPEAVLVIGSNTYTEMTERHLTHRLLRISDATKIEFMTPLRGEFIPGKQSKDGFGEDAAREPEDSLRLSAGFALARDAADGRPPHIWTYFLLNEVSALYAMAGEVAHGCVANIDMQDREIPNLEYASALQLGAKVSPAFARRRPMGWARVHYCELARDRIAKKNLRSDFVWPFLGPFKVCIREGLPVAAITDSQLDEGVPEHCRVLFLPQPDALTDAMKKSVAAFEKRGGTVIRQRPEWRWHDRGAGHEKTMAACRRSIAKQLAEVPVQVVGLPPKAHAETFVDEKGEGVTVAINNDFSWVHIGPIAHRPEAEQERLKSVAAPPPMKGVRIVWRAAKPKAVKEVASGRELEARKAGDGVWEIAIPSIEALAVVTIEK